MKENGQDKRCIGMDIFEKIRFAIKLAKELGMDNFEIQSFQGCVVI